MDREDIYRGREQTLVKHFVLQHYLERFAHIVGTKWSSITYIDGFAGPWNVRSEGLEDSSFAIALRELRKAQHTHRTRGREIRLRCFFLEENKGACSRLAEFAQKATGTDEIVVRNSSFESSIKEIREFIRRGGEATFPFVFIDPTGWTGFSLDVITPLLKLQPGEVLINFMTGHIRRFLSEEQSQSSFEKLFGSARFKSKIEGLSGVAREDAAVAEYMENVRKAGAFKYTCAAMVLHPEIDRTHFHLIYATRHPKGIEVFKEAERRAMEVMERLRAEAQSRLQEERTGQLSFLTHQESPASRHYNDLRNHYLERARARLSELLRLRRHLEYDQAWTEALSSPLVWESDLKEWIRSWQKSGDLVLEGLRAKQSVPKRDSGHVLIWSKS